MSDNYYVLFYDIIYLVIVMNNSYEFYINYIKPIEKKYNLMAKLYSFFKFPIFNKRKLFYNSILIYYYKYIQNNSQEFKELEKYY